MKRVAIIQSNYLPWVGYFDLLLSVDKLVFLDSVQYTRRDWRNRNKIKSPNGDRWITVPVHAKGNYFQAINNTKILGDEWKKEHLDLIQGLYSKSLHFSEISAKLHDLLYEKEDVLLSKLNRRLTASISKWLGIDVEFLSDIELLPDCESFDKSERLAVIAKNANASTYVSGPAARDYIDEKYFNDLGIELSWFEYKSYPPYAQSWGEFIPNLSIVDYMFNCGLDSFSDYVDKR